MFVTSKAVRLGVALTTLALALAAVLLLSHDHASAKTAKRSHSRALAASAGGYQILDRAPNADDRDNSIIEGAAQHDATLQVSHARVLTADSQGKTWLIPTTDGRLCLAQQPAGQYDALESQRGLGRPALMYVCNAAATVEGHGLVLRTYDDITGLVPDGVDRVATQIRGRSGNAAVARNLYHAQTRDSGFSHGSAEFTAPNGSPVTQDLP
ncbi:MAG: hypothetical protein JWO74_1613 [Solirubrobacterales bacterium]|nr:hypothetical protein [Solirubrobacterales bacterium]